MIVNIPERTDDQLFNDCMISYLHELDHSIRRIIHDVATDEDITQEEIMMNCFKPWLDRVKK